MSQGGTNVSGGQKQRLSIARALVKKPKIYIFDDSFSALDFRTDRALREALREKVGGSTIIIVAQRINTILDSDQILVMDEGRLVGKGTHSHLMESCDVYREIALSQLSEEELERGSSNGGENKQLQTSRKKRRTGRRYDAGRKSPRLQRDDEDAAGYLKPYKFRLAAVFVFAIASTVFTIISPTVLGETTDKVWKAL